MKWIEGFETFGSVDSNISEHPALLGKYGQPTATSIVTTLRAGRHFGVALEFGSAASPRFITTPAFTPAETIAVGFSFRTGSVLPNGDIIRLYDGDSSYHLGLTVSGGILRVNRNGTTLDGESEAGLVLPNSWYALELKATIDGVTGSYEVRLNEQTVASGSDLNTQNGGNASVDRVQLRGSATSNATCRYDHWWVGDDFLGDMVVEAIYPTSDVVSDWTPSTGSDNYALVDERPANGDTDYVEATTGEERYGLSGLSNITSDVEGIQLNADMRATDATPFDVALKVNGNALPAHSVDTTDYRTYFNIVTIDPDTSQPWELADLNILEAGVEIT